MNVASIVFFLQLQHDLATLGETDMDKLLDSAAGVSFDQLDSVQADLIRRDLNRGGVTTFAGASSESMAEAHSLREFNSKLLERIGDFRKQNLALSTSENALRASLLNSEKRCADLERKLAKLTDEKWEKALEVEALTKLEISQRDEIEKIRQEATQAIEEIERRQVTRIESLIADAAELKNRLDASISENTRLAERLAASERTNLDQAARIDEADQLIAGLEIELEASKQELMSARETSSRTLAANQEHQAQLAGKLQAMTVRETQLIAAFESLRAEYASIDACYKEASTNVVRMRGEFEVQSRMLADAQKDVESLNFERARLQQLLEVKEVRDESERTKIQTSREQLDFLERHLRQVSEALKKDKTEILRLAKQIAEELQPSRQHPFKEYLQAAEMELLHLQSQLAAMSEMSPTRSRLEARISQSIEHRDILKTALLNSERHLEERIQAVQSIIRHASN
jgi:hypothetical protein